MSTTSRKRGKNNQPRDSESQNLNNEAEDLHENDEVENPQDDINPQSLQGQINDLCATLSDHSKVLTTLQDVPSILANLSSALGINREEENESLQNECSDEDDLMNQFMGSDATESQDKGTDDNDELLGILNISQPSTEFGENLGEAVAKSFERMVTHRPAKEKIEKWAKELKPPENCKVLAVPRVNPEIWPQLKSRSRNGDLNYQQQATFISQAQIVVSRMADKIFEASKQIPKDLGKDLLSMSMDAGAILGIASQEISVRRKADLRPHLNKEFASICSSKNAPTEWLFGDNVLDQLKASKNAANVMKPAFQPSFQSRGQRYQPYKPRPSLNFKQPFFQQKGGAFQNQQRQSHPRPFMRAQQSRRPN